MWQSIPGSPPFSEFLFMCGRAWERGYVNYLTSNVCYLFILGSPSTSKWFTQLPTLVALLINTCKYWVSVIIIMLELYMYTHKMTIILWAPSVVASVWCHAGLPIQGLDLLDRIQTPKSREWTAWNRIEYMRISESDELPHHWCAVNYRSPCMYSVPVKKMWAISHIWSSVLHVPVELVLLVHVAILIRDGCWTQAYMSRFLCHNPCSHQLEQICQIKKGSILYTSPLNE